MPLEELQKYFFLLRDRDATNHLLRVSAGLESLVMGEGQAPQGAVAGMALEESEARG